MADDPLAAWLEQQEPTEQTGAPDPTVQTLHWDTADVGPAPEAGPPPLAGASGWSGFVDFDEDRDRRHRLIAFAVIPWLVAGALALFLWQREAPDAAQPIAAGTDAEAAGEQAAAGSAPAQGAARPEPRPGDTTFLAAATLSLRDAVAGQAQGGTRYLDHAAAEHIEWVGDVAVVTVLAVVLTDLGGRWSAPRSARYAVPLRAVEGTPVRAGEPWALPPPGARGAALRWTRTAQLPDGAAEALEAAGYRGLAGAQAWSHPSLPDVVRVTAAALAPGERERRRQDVWVRTAPAPTVLGAR